MKPPLVIHHRDQDGFVGALVAEAMLNKPCEFYDTNYGEVAPDVTGRDVIVVDFSFPRDQQIAMQKKAKSIHTFDHHEKAQESLAGLPNVSFDMKRAGCQVLSDHLKEVCPDAKNWEEVCKERPGLKVLSDYASDKDLWQFKLPNSREINTAIDSRELTRDAYGEMEKLTTKDLYTEGQAMMRYRDSLIHQISKDAELAEMKDEKGKPFRFLAVNGSLAIRSDLGEALVDLAKEHKDELGCEPVGVVYQKKGDIVQASFRSDGSVNVNHLLEPYGGGGHPSAAAARFPENPPWKVLDAEPFKTHKMQSPIQRETSQQKATVLGELPSLKPTTAPQKQPAR